MELPSWFTETHIEKALQLRPGTITFIRSSGVPKAEDRFQILAVPEEVTRNGVRVRLEGTSFTIPEGA